MLPDLQAGDLTVAHGTSEALEQYDWNLDKASYINLLREYDGHRDPRRLAEFVAVLPFGA